MKLKEIVKTKTFWSGIALVVYGILTKDPQSVMSGLSVIFLRDAMLKKESE
jgi:hypothetical protein